MTGVREAADTARKFHCIDCSPGEIHSTRSTHPFRAATTAGWPDERDPVIGRCGRCGKWYDEHPSGFCPDQIGTDGWVAVGTAEEWRPIEVAGSVDAAGVDARNAENPAPRSTAPGIEARWQEMEHPFDKAEFDAMYARAVAAEAKADTLEAAAANVLHEYDLWAEDANDGEFAIWSRDNFMASFSVLRTALIAAAGGAADSQPDLLVGKHPRKPGEDTVALHD